MPTLEITVQRRLDGSWPVVAEYSRTALEPPTRVDGTLLLDPAALLAASAPRAYGTVLGQALFQGDVGRLFDIARADNPACVRVLLAVEVPELKGWHWERLCAPVDLGGHWDFLALDQRLPFSLYLPSTSDRRFPPIGSRDLRALILVAEPSDLKQWGLVPFDAAAAVDLIREALGPIPCDVLASVPEAVGPPTLNALCAQLTAQPYSLLHVMAHGRAGS